MDADAKESTATSTCIGDWRLTAMAYGDTSRERNETGVPEAA